MKLLALGRRVLNRRQSSCAASGCHDQCHELPPCPSKPFWNGKRTMFFSLLTFGAGTYTGIYVSQNYEVPRVDDPRKLVERMNAKIRELIDGDKKKTPVEQIVHDIKKEAKKIMDD